MTNSVIVENKISATKKYLKICAAYQKYSLKQIESDINIRGMVERYLYLAVQSAIDLAESYIAFKKFRKPTTMSECFHILEEEGVIKKELVKKMVSMTGFRNILSHDYEKINYAIVYDVLHNGLADIKKLLKALE